MIYPFVRQKKTNDCGASCIEMIAKYYCKPYKSTLIIKDAGITVGDIQTELNNTGLNCAAIRIDFKNLIKINYLPCIAFVTGNHYIVIWEINHSSLLIADPQNGLISLPFAEFCRIWLCKRKAFGIVIIINPA